MTPLKTSLRRAQPVPPPACGGGLGRGFACDGGGDDLRYTRTICHDIQIAESQNAESFHLQKRIATSIARESLTLEVLAAVDLDDQIRGVTDEIRNVGADWNLFAEGCAVQSMCAENIPDDALGLGQVCTELAGARTLKC